MSEKGYALRVGGEVWVARNATAADHAAALAMMTTAERQRTAKRLERDLKWMVWQVKHPRLTAFLAGANAVGLAMVRW